MNEPSLVADASAILALLQNERFIGFEPERLVGATISAVNFCEVLAKLWATGMPEAEAEAAIAALDLRIAAFDATQARVAARLSAPTRRAGLSLADRACLTLGLVRNEPVATADRAWANLDTGSTVILIR